MYELIKLAKNTAIDLTVFDMKWSSFKATKKNRVFPMVVSALKAWHRMGARVDLHCHSTVASMPLFNNKYVVDVDGETVVPPVNVM